MNEGALGAVLRRLRAQHKLSLRTLAERTDFSASFLSQLENNQSAPSLASIEKIASAFGLTVVQFFQLIQEEEAAAHPPDT